MEPGRRFDRLWGRGTPTAGAVGSNSIVQPSPLLDEDDGLGQRVEDLAVQELVPQLAVEALVVAVLPRTAGLDVERLHTEPGEPPPHELRGELRPVVRTQMLGWTVPNEEIRQNLEYVMPLESSVLP